MYALLKGVITIGLVVLLTGCAGKKPITALQVHQLDDCPVTDSSVVVLLGVDSEKPISFLDVNGKIKDIPTHGFDYKQERFHVVALDVSEVEDFQITESIFYYENLGTHIQYMKYSFDKLPVLKMAGPGLYYYGILFEKEGKLGFRKEIDDQVIPYTKLYYKGLLKNLKRVNF